MQLTDEHFERAVLTEIATGTQTAKKAAQQMSETTRIEMKQEKHPTVEHVGHSSECGLFQADSKSCDINQMAPAGLEPARALLLSGF